MAALFGALTGAVLGAETIGYRLTITILAQGEVEFDGVPAL